MAILLLLAVPLAACSSPSRHSAVPVELADRATVLGNPAIRTWDDAFSQPFLDELIRATTLELDAHRAAGRDGPLPPAVYLAVSGGGADGAYGAGILCGWTAMGTRPQFKAVTGISTGALTAPFAFLGPEYDERLKTVYTSVKTEQIAIPRGILAALFNDALMDTSPLRKLMLSMVDEAMMADIAREYARGRLLFVATTNLDANRGVIWNVGAIASSGDPGALQLIHDILIASAAIPAAFPPVMIDVEIHGEADGESEGEIGGERFQEMHVDGGTKAQVFLYPPTFRLQSAAAAEGFDRPRTAYVIRNGRLDPQWASVQRSTLPIAGRAIGSLIQSQGVGDLYRIYLLAQRDGVGFNLAFIPPTFNVEPAEDFDPVYMTELFDLGYARATEPGGYPWEDAPPDLADPMNMPATAVPLLGTDP
jgi:predicted acylesterase/phospholipase RssA